jgi:hypothetical protein
MQEPPASKGCLGSAFGCDCGCGCYVLPVAQVRHLLQVLKVL